MNQTYPALLIGTSHQMEMFNKNNESFFRYVNKEIQIDGGYYENKIFWENPNGKWTHWRRATRFDGIDHITIIPSIQNLWNRSYENLLILSSIRIGKCGPMFDKCGKAIKKDIMIDRLPVLNAVIKDWQWISCDDSYPAWCQKYWKIIDECGDDEVFSIVEIMPNPPVFDLT